MSNRVNRSVAYGNMSAGQTNKHFRSVELKREMKEQHLGHYATARDIGARVQQLKMKRVTPDHQEREG